jgi:hypothetical protein
MSSRFSPVTAIVRLRPGVRRTSVMAAPSGSVPSCLTLARLGLPRIPRRIFENRRLSEKPCSPSLGGGAANW